MTQQEIDALVQASETINAEKAEKERLAEANAKDLELQGLIQAMVDSNQEQMDLLTYVVKEIEKLAGTDQFDQNVFQVAVANRRGFIDFMAEEAKRIEEEFYRQ